MEKPVNITNNYYFSESVSKGKSDDFTTSEGETTKVVDFSADLDADKTYNVSLYEVHGTAPTETLKQVVLGLATGLDNDGFPVALSNALLTISPSAVTFTLENLSELQKYKISVLQF